jgi:hypothetical protein
VGGQGTSRANVRQFGEIVQALDRVPITCFENLGASRRTIYEGFYLSADRYE